MSILIKNGRVLDPDTGKDGIYDVLIEDGLIQKVEPKLDETADTEIDAEGCFVMPGLIDLHVHLRDPGLTYKETVESSGSGQRRFYHHRGHAKHKAGDRRRTQGFLCPQ